MAELARLRRVATDEWLATFADPIPAQSAIDRFTSNACDLVIEGESYRPRLKPWLAKAGKARSRRCRLMGGHWRVLHTTRDRIALRCVACGQSSPGWQVGRRGQRLAADALIVEWQRDSDRCAARQAVHGERPGVRLHDAS